MTKWHRGPPPSIGWWPADFSKNISVLRWWNGQHWSIGVASSFSMADVRYCAHIKAFNQDFILWTDRPSTWPEKSRT
jgi:hypothetical protein